MNSEQKFYEDQDGKNITPFGVDKPLHKWFEEVNEIDPEKVLNLNRSKEEHETFQRLVYGNWIDAPAEPIQLEKGKIYICSGEEIIYTGQKDDRGFIFQLKNDNTIIFIPEDQIKFIDKKGFKKVQNIAIICYGSREFLQFCKQNPDDSKAYYYVHSKDSAAGRHFDDYIILDKNVRDQIALMEFVKKRMRNENN